MGIKHTIMKTLGAYDPHLAQIAAIELDISEQRRQYDETRRESNSIMAGLPSPGKGSTIGHPHR